jgi:hypothetical protein
MLLTITFVLAMVIVLLAIIPASAPVTGEPVAFGLIDNRAAPSGLASGGGNLVPLW